jgi:hypothetical protein
MSQIKNKDWKAEDYISLGTQTSPTAKDIIWDAWEKAKYWAPKNAKSCTLSAPRNTDYSHTPTGDKITGYASFYVTYYTTTKEGETPLN